MEKHKMTSLQTIENFFENYDFNDGKISISKCEKVIDVKKFVFSHIEILKNNSGNMVFMPYYSRIEKLYLILKSEI